MNWEPPGFAHGRAAAGCGSQSEARLRGSHRQRLRDPTWVPARVGGGAHQEGGKIASPLVPTDHFPAVVASRPNAQTTRTTPSVGRRKEAHFSSFRFPSSSLWFSCQNTHSAPLHSPLSSLSPNTQRRDWTERARSLSGRSTASLAVSRSEEEKRGRKRAERAEEKKTLEIQ